MEYIIRTTNSELYHHGIIGQKWGVRRYQNPDGTLTSAGKKHSIVSTQKPKFTVDPISIKEKSTKTYGSVKSTLHDNKQTIKKGAKIGAVAGATIGAVSMAGATALLVKCRGVKVYTLAPEIISIGRGATKGALLAAGATSTLVLAKNKYSKS